MTVFVKRQLCLTLATLGVLSAIAESEPLPGRHFISLVAVATAFAVVSAYNTVCSRRLNDLKGIDRYERGRSEP